jgi:hypothetical protein
VAKFIGGWVAKFIGGWVAMLEGDWLSWRATGGLVGGRWVAKL